MANRVLAIRRLAPPYDLEQLASAYGNLEYLELPFGVDGITIGIGESTKPLILVNSSAPATRRKFTLAHEIGHVVIPWHTGTIVSHLENGKVDAAYSQMESEANRFAAELLMPSQWLVAEFQRSANLEQYFRSVLAQSGASREATLNKILRPLPCPVICIHVDSASRILSARKSTSAPHLPIQGTIVNNGSFGADNNFEQFEIDSQLYMSWTFVGRDIKEVDNRPWRAVLAQIMEETAAHQYLQSINGVLAAAYGRDKALSEPEICGAIIRAFTNKENLKGVLEHELFEQFVVKRVKELKQRI